MKKDCNGKKIPFSLTVKREKNKLDQIFTYSGGVYCPVYHLPFDGVEKDKAIDHVTRHMGINIREFLRVCTNKENNLNKRPVLRKSEKEILKIQEDEKYFSFSKCRLTKSDLKSLKNDGYTVKGNRVTSPKFESDTKLEQEKKKVLDMISNRLVDKFEIRLENMEESEFNYNPLFDFEDTWYALFLYKLFPNNISRRNVEDYNKDYFRRNHKEIAKVYNL